MWGDFVKIKKLLSILCSVTCVIGGASTRADVGDSMKGVVSKLRSDSNIKRGKSLKSFGNFARNFFLPGNYSKEGEEIIKARGVHSLLNDETYADVARILEELDKNPKAEKKIQDLANKYKVSSWVKYVIRLMLTPGATVLNVLSLVFIPIGVKAVFSALKQIIKNEDHQVQLGPNDSTGGLFNYWLPISLALFSTFSLGGSFGISALGRSSIKDWGVKETLGKLVEYSEKIRKTNNQLKNDKLLLNREGEFKGKPRNVNSVGFKGGLNRQRSSTGLEIPKQDSPGSV